MNAMFSQIWQSSWRMHALPGFIDSESDGCHLVILYLYLWLFCNLFFVTFTWPDNPDSGSCPKYSHSIVCRFGPDYWVADFNMKCDETFDNLFQLKFTITVTDSSVDWETDRSQGTCTGDYPFTNPISNSIDHIAVCGKINVFEHNQDWCRIYNFPWSDKRSTWCCGYRAKDSWPRACFPLLVMCCIDVLGKFLILSHPRQQIKDGYLEEWKMLNCDWHSPK